MIIIMITNDHATNHNDNGDDSRSSRGRRERPGPDLGGAAQGVRAPRDPQALASSLWPVEDKTACNILLFVSSNVDMTLRNFLCQCVVNFDVARKKKPSALDVVSRTPCTAATRLAASWPGRSGCGQSPNRDYGSQRVDSSTVLQLLKGHPSEGTTAHNKRISPNFIRSAMLLSAS